jgi:hypothetical protein
MNNLPHYHSPTPNPPTSLPLMLNSTVVFIPNSDTCSAVTDQCPVSATVYGYAPNLPGNILFAVWFGVIFVIGLGFGIRSKAWTFTLALGIGTGGEMLGYIGRLWMHQNAWSSGAFQMQICCLILGPTFLAACIYLTLKHLVLHFGTEHSYLKASLYPWIFVGCDIVSILLQAIGGGVAASAIRKRAVADTGNALMIAGIGFQVLTMTMCGLLAAIYFFRYKKSNRPASSDGSDTESPEKVVHDAKARRKIAMFCSAVGVAYLTILIRCVYR